MGLDMYLIKKKHIGKAKIEIKENKYEWYKNENQAFDNVNELSIEKGYWRKANQVHNWFVNNIQDGNDDCEEHYVPYEKTKQLLDICKKIKEKCPLRDGKVMTNVELAKELLPTKSGFFFGGTGYDQYYMDDIENTIKILESIEETDDIYYQSSW